MLSSNIICHFPGSGGATPLCQLGVSKFRGTRVGVESLGKKLKNGEYSQKCEGSWIDCD